MLKKYSANSHVAISVTFANGAHKHISFTPRSNGQSVYYTSDAAEQAALETHYKFGHLYKLVSASNAPAMPKPYKVQQSVEKSVTKAEAAEIKVSDFAEAKDYLCDKFGLSRTKLRSEKSILDVAKEHRIKFIGL